MSMRFDLAGRMSSRRAGYEVVPSVQDDRNLMEPVVLCVRAEGPFGLQDYLTPDEADALADLLKAGAAHARVLNADRTAAAA